MTPSSPGYLGPPTPAPGATQIHGVNVKQENQIDGTGRTVSHLVITFFVGTHGPFSLSFPLATFEPAAVQQALQQFAQKVAQLQPQQ